MCVCVCVHSTLQNNSYEGILRNIMGYNVFVFAHASQQVDTQIITGMFTLIM